MLIGTNLAHYIATSIVTSMFLGTVGSEHTAELFATMLTVPILFIFAELIPKNMFFYRADLLMPYFSPVLYSFHTVLRWSGIVPLLKFISSFFARLMGLATASKTVIASAQRHKVQAILHDTHEEGFLSPVQTEIDSIRETSSNLPATPVIPHCGWEACFALHMSPLSHSKPMPSTEIKQRLGS